MTELPSRYHVTVTVVRDGSDLEYDGYDGGSRKYQRPGGDRVVLQYGLDTGRILARLGIRGAAACYR